MKEILQIGICDDKQDYLKMIEIAVCNNAKRVGIPIPIECVLFQDGEEMCREMAAGRFDLALLDIEMR